MEHPPFSLTRDPQFWERKWLEAKARSPINRRYRFDEKEEIEAWNRRAASYARQTESECSRLKKIEILRQLESAGALHSDFRVLDIGAGPGNFTLPLSARVKEVVALEPAVEMLKILESRVKRAGLTNVKTINRPWQAIDPEGEEFAGAFDLAFASMSPGINDPDALKKMNRVSRHSCYLSGWSGPNWGRWGRAQTELWQIIFNEDPGDYPSDMLYPFGLLYSLGYRPEIRFMPVTVSLEEKKSDAAEGLISLFEQYTEIGAAERKLIEEYVSSRCSQDLFRMESRACQGFMTWRVDSRCF
ncbi:MAG TPA: class I SAM-dependent methyltransferase [Spirochaetia bacterium]|nr:class I SAM-dependent methyltransferase [Spirochaetia bacterium]